MEKPPERGVGAETAGRHAAAVQVAPVRKPTVEQAPVSLGALHDAIMKIWTEQPDLGVKRLVTILQADSTLDGIDTKAVRVALKELKQ